VPTYECVLILNPQLTDEQTTETIEQVKSLIVSHQGELLNVDIWGKKRLAYEIRKMREGFFVVLTFKLQGQTGLMAELERVTKHSEAVIRQMIVKAPAVKPAPEKEEAAPEKVESATPEPSTDQPVAQPTAPEPTEAPDEKSPSQGGKEDA
jgi:small subunit ribosomal protein S6